MVKKCLNQAIFSLQSWAGHPWLLLLLMCLLPGAAASFLPTQPHQNTLGWLMAGLAGAVFLLWGGLSLRKQLPRWADGVCWWGIGYFLRFGYILRFPYQLMQHDVLTFDGERGHAGYILYLFRSGHLPDFDVRNVWQYYHPPLHHLLCAGWMRLMQGIGMEEVQSYEALQALPFAYSCLLLAVFGLILREFDLKGFNFTVPFSILAVHPSQIILGGSLNNDMLSILLMGTSLLVGLRWFRVPKYSTALLLGLTLGLGMFAKLSAWMAVPPALLLLLWKLCCTSERRRIAKQALWGAAAGLPFGLFWSVRNWVGWGVPPAYIPMLADDSGQYVGNHPIWERLLDWSPGQFTFIYDCYTIYGQTYNEYNPVIGLLKTAVFDEFVNTSQFPAVAGFGECLFWTQFVLALLTLAAMVYVLRTKVLCAERCALLLTYLLVLGCYILFCLTYPHTCTQSFRYAVPVLYTSLVFAGLFLRDRQLPRWGTAGIGVLTGGFVLCSGLIYGVLLFLPA